MSIEDHNCSYTWVPWRLSLVDGVSLLLFDRAPHHKGGRNVAYTDGSIQFLSEEEFQTLYAEQKKRFEDSSERSGMTALRR